jgi:hypothetical protein
MLIDSRPVALASDQFEAFCAERRQLAQQERLRRWLHGWYY